MVGAASALPIAALASLRQVAPVPKRVALLVVAAVFKDVGGAAVKDIWGSAGVTRRCCGVGNGGVVHGVADGAGAVSAEARSATAGALADGAPPLGGLAEGRGNDDVGARGLSPARQLESPRMFASGDARQSLPARWRWPATGEPQPSGTPVSPCSASAAERKRGVPLDERNLVPQVAPFLGLPMGDVARTVLRIMSGGRFIAGRPCAAPLASPDSLAARPVMLAPVTCLLLVARPADALHSALLGGWEHREGRAQRPRDERGSAQVVVEGGALLLGGLGV